MVGRHSRSQRGALVLVALVALVLPVSAAACAEVSSAWQLAGVSSLSDWRESDSSGRQLVHESGRLHGAELALGRRCAHWRWLAAVSQLDGTRGYDGETSTGVAATSNATVRQRQAQLQASLNVTAAWQAGGRLSAYRLWRDVASIDGAAGFSERFDWTLLALGAEWRTAAAPGHFTLAAWLGKSVRSSLVLTVPGRDPAMLAPGSITQLELAAGWRAQLSPAWHLQADAGYRRTGLGEGAHGVITRNGVPVAVAHQPRTRIVEVPLAIRVGYDF